jgi:serine/threonine-protein kinase
MTALTPDFIALQAALAGEYSLQRELGRGGMGIVYLARDVQLDRDVAIKVLPSHLAARPGLRARFMREARTAAGLSHPNIVPIHRVGEAGGFVFFVMAYVPGQTLGEKLRASGPLAGADAMRVMREIAWALEYAHEHGIIHRDIKPDNILLEHGSGRVLVTDFGIARSSDADDVHQSDPGRIAGTAHFMSPEQAAGETLDGRSDLYSLGVVGYLSVSGRLPFDASSVPAALVRQATETPLGVSHVAPGVPRELAAVIDRCLARRADERYDSGKAVADALQPKQDGPRALPPALRNWLRARNPAQPVFIGLYTVAAVSVVQHAVITALSHRLMFGELGFPALLMAVPLVPILGYHITQARRVFLAGYSLGDLRSAIALDEAERRDAHVVESKSPLTKWQRYLQVVSYGSIGQSLLVTAMAVGTNRWPPSLIGLSYLGALAALGLSNAFNVPLLPASLRRGPRGIRDRLWMSRVGGWVAKLIGAPDRSAPVGDAIFRPTEVALGVAAGELFAALPTSYRQQLADLPLIVKNLEARAADARAHLDELASHLADDGRRDMVRRTLAESVGALENIRLDLLRLHAGESDVAPMTTLLDAARSVGADVERLIVAQREVSVIRRTPRRLGANRTPTPV